ncbi:MAG TPA: DUF4845 domain-containing protein [Gallionellaceae bacterium]|nr:DUF4845 domain-containing protein [Gallionellaceae bacterium]
MNAMIKQQLGFSFTGFIVAACLLITAALFGMKLIPSYMQNAKVQKAFDAMVRDPAMQDAPEKDVRMSFYNRAVTMDSVTVVNENTIDVYKDNGKLVLSADYSVKVPLAGNVSLLIEFHPTTAK